MKAVRKYYSTTAAELGPRRVRVQCSSASPDRSGDIVEQGGASYATSIPLLWAHDPEQPIGRAYPAMGADGNLVAEVEFAPEGVSAKADEICGLVKAGVIDTVSIGFEPKDMEPLDPRRPLGPQHYKGITLLELSFVSIPANADAQVVARQMEQNAVNTEKAALAQHLRDLAKQATGKAQGSAYRHAANLIEKGVEPVRLSRKGLYEIGWLAELLAEAAFLEECLEWEAMTEGDGSPNPAAMRDILRQLGALLVSVTQEEVAELLADESEDETELSGGREDMTGAGVVDKTAIFSALTQKAGRVLSARNAAALVEARDLIDEVVSQVAPDEEDSADKAKAARMREAEALRLRFS